eukprot:TRINITY_DN21790_c0_g1_i1.p1 TRINITY_DN21790_c0_g1~~TRINITY_DN21790_c0_g1_i1.p1  ORF type:complete len:218 (-),score=40.03 TRINITY_DN21790_c0_g1_i1:30-683(-)
MYAQEFPVHPDIAAGWYGNQRARLALNVRVAARSVTGVKGFVLGVEDRNKDGVLDREELTQEHFDALDKDSDGGIDTSEFLYSIDTADPQGDPSLDCPGGWSMLHYAAAAGRLEVVKFLFSAGADVNLRDYNDQSALMLARQRGHDEVVAFLQAPDWGSRGSFRIRMGPATAETLDWSTAQPGRVHIWHGHPALSNFLPATSGFALSSAASSARGYV